MKHFFLLLLLAGSMNAISQTTCGDFYTDDVYEWQRIKICTDNQISIYYGKRTLLTDEKINIIYQWIDKTSTNTIKFIATLYTIPYCITYNTQNNTVWLQQISNDTDGVFMKFTRKK